MNIAREAEIQRVVRWIQYPTQETDLIRETKSWNDDDFLYAIDRVQTDLGALPKEQQDQIRRLYRALLKERQDENARIASEKASAQRHEEISRRLDELKKPHWSITPNFWMTAAILILTFIGVVVAILSLHR
jgi:hypothetical protein